MLDRRLPHGARVIALLALLLAFLLPPAAAGATRRPRPARARTRPPSRLPTAAFYGEATRAPERRREERRRRGRAQGRCASRTPAPSCAGCSTRAARRHRLRRDVEPWLGQRVGGFVLMPAQRIGRPRLGPRARDRRPRRASTTRCRACAAGRARAAARYRGIAYDKTTSDGHLRGRAVGDFYVAGTLAGLQSGDRRVEEAPASPRHRASRTRSARSRTTRSRSSTSTRRRSSPPRATCRRCRRPRAERSRDSPTGGPVVASLTATADEIAIEGSGQSPLGDTSSGDAEVTRRSAAGRRVARARHSAARADRQRRARRRRHPRPGGGAGARRSSASISTETCLHAARRPRAVRARRVAARHRRRCAAAA